MKKFKLYLLIPLFISSCSYNQSETIIIETLDQFESQKENEQMGKDLFAYPYASHVPSSFSDFSPEVLKNISWQYFVKSSDSKVSFRLTLSNQAMNHKDEIVEYFELAVNNQIDKQIKDKAKFNKAIELSNECFKLLDNHQEDEFWQLTSPIMRNVVSKDEFLKILSSRDNISEIGGNRYLQYKYHFDSIPGIKEKGYYVIGFGFEKDASMIEQFNIHDHNGNFQIVRYDYRTSQK